MTPRTVLVVDDDDMIRQLAQISLETVNGWTVLTADGGLAAIDMAVRHRPDAVLLDMMMPDMDGLTTFQHLQADPATRETPVVLFTAKSTVGGQEPWDDYAISGVIAKPFDPMTLGAQIAAMLRWTSP
ncbi:response regulator [Nocardioides sp. cx-173]|uniref:response regulator n=1 Tax=Nocardioides sp. cx-173 TaxID=2898796 RepID=UPI001E4BB470|nr:response regulator [Nocardioides sp. cx-173]MCD4525169.1 response regulator [Nocardioides sp. cx-173]UGB40134.1 response regulator [Nocardioides sp. cx-173]